MYSLFDNLLVPKSNERWQLATVLFMSKNWAAARCISVRKKPGRNFWIFLSVMEELQFPYTFTLWLFSRWDDGLSYLNVHILLGWPSFEVNNVVSRRILATFRSHTHILLKMRNTCWVGNALPFPLAIASTPHQEFGCITGVLEPTTCLVC